MKLTYAEQLKHPNWQRKRLEVMEAAGFECEECGAADDMLHVHHKRYVKGRMAWDYERGELACLCGKCHETEHALKGKLEELLAQVDTRSAFAVLAGYFHMADWIERELLNAGRDAYALTYADGVIASLAAHVTSIGLKDEAVSMVVSLTGPRSEARMIHEHNCDEVFGREKVE